MTQVPSDFLGKRDPDTAAAPWFASFALDFATPQLKRGAEVWSAKRNGRTMPSRNDLTIGDLKFLLPNLAFIDIVRSETMRFRVRLMGGMLDELVAPMTGHFIDEVVPAHFAQKWSRQWMSAITGRQAVRSVGRVEFAGRRWYVAESLYAPLAHDGETADILMVVAFYHAIDKTEAGTTDVARQLMAEIETHGPAAASTTSQ